MNNKKNSFLMLVEQALQKPGRSHMRSVIEKELSKIGFKRSLGAQ